MSIQDSVSIVGHKIDWDTTRNEGYWKRALRHGKFNPYDTTVTYPRFVDFCLKVYRWGDRTFNSYDSLYVTPTGKNWKLMVKNYNWFDSYAGWLSKDRTHLLVSSPMNSLLGGQISFMAVSYSYMFDIDNIIDGDAGKHKKWDFSFTCARFSIEAYSSKNMGKTRLHHLGNFRKGKYFTEDFYGMERSSFGYDFFYIFNHKKYSQAAAYCYSKIQRRSAGSLIGGFLMSTQDVKVDFSSLDHSMYTYLPVDNDNKTIDYYRYYYRDYNLIIGYAYNWVMGRNWLFNITALPGIGYKRCFEQSTEGKKKLFSFNVRGKVGIVRNKGNFFYAGQINFDGHLYSSSYNHFFNSIIELNLIGGFRF